MNQTQNSKQAGGEQFITSLGKRVEIVGVSPFEIEQIRATVHLPDVPTRQVETAVPGYVEKEPLTANDLRDEEERARWARYVLEHTAAETKRNTLTADFIMLEGCRFEMDDLEAWKARRERWNMPIPDNAMDLQVVYFRTAVVGSLDDMNHIISTVMRRQGVDEETLKSVSSTFQRSVQQHAAVAAADTERQVVVQRAVPRSQDSALLGHQAAEPLLHVQRDGSSRDDRIHARSGTDDRV